MKNKRIIIYFLFIFGAMFPAMSFAVDYVGSEKPKDSDFQLVPCDGVKVPCDFNALMTLFNRVVNFILYISIPLAAISFSYAGYLYISAAGNSGKIEEAHKIFWSVLIGFIFVSSAWLIVYTIQKALLSSDFKNSDANFLRDSGGGGNVSGGNGDIDSGYNLDTSESDSGYNGGKYNDGTNYIEGTKNPLDEKSLELDTSTGIEENSSNYSGNYNDGTSYIEGTKNPFDYEPNLKY